MKTYNFRIVSIAILFLFFLSGCSDKEDENGVYVPPTEALSDHPNDVYLRTEMLDKYETAVRWRWNDRFVNPNQNASPIQSEFVIPVTKLIEYLWISPYTSVGQGGVDFIDELFPPELQYIGSYIYKDDGTILLGFAEGGARISLLNLNSYDLTDRIWLTNPGGGILSTVHHEFSHIVHQNYGIPTGFNTISDSYLGAGWSNGVSRDDAIKMGMVRNYGTLNEFEDFCEIVSHFLTLEKAVFENDFINQEDCSALSDADEIANCRELNEGRLLISQKLDLVLDHYKNTFNIDLVQVRDDLEAKINYVVTNNEIPE